MKFLKISSLLVLSLLLFVPAAFADVDCELRPNSQRIRVESENEELGAIRVRCTWEANDIVAVDGNDPDDSTFDLEIQFSGDVSNDEDTPATLWIVDDADATAAVDADDEVDPPTFALDEDGNRLPAPMAEMGSDSVYWEDVTFPDSWNTGSATSGLITIAMVNIDATSVAGERLEATITMDAEDLADNAVLTSDAEAVSVARVDQALNLEFGEDEKAVELNACVPGEFTTSVTLDEGFRNAWDPGNDILLMASSGKITAKDTGIFDVTGEGDDDELIIDVTPTSSTDSADIAITFEPASGAVGDDLTLSAMLLPMRRSDESFVVSSTLVVGTYTACEGESLFFPFVTSMSGWDTGIVVANDSDGDGSCSLNWGNVTLDDDQMAALSTIDVDGKDHMAFLVSRQRGADYSGSLGVVCSFSDVTGYVFLSDTANNIGQGYLVHGM